jgi:hypothetical protein
MCVSCAVHVQPAGAGTVEVAKAPPGPPVLQEHPTLLTPTEQTTTWEYTFTVMCGPLCVLYCLQAAGTGTVEVAKAPPAPPVLQEDLTLPGVASHPAPPAAPVLAILQVGRGGKGERGSFTRGQSSSVAPPQDGHLHWMCLHRFHSSLHLA